MIKVIKIGQQECYSFLKENIGWFTTREISEKIKASQASTNNAMRRLVHSGFVESRIRITKNRRPLEYKMR